MIFSIIVPIYNAEKFLKECLDSIISQTYEYDNFETILINDGSTDNSLQIIKEYVTKMKNTRCISRENRGLLYTRLEGIKNARGKYIIFLDSDDFLPKNCLKDYYTEIKEHNYDLVRGNYYSIKENNKKVLVANFKNNFCIYDNKEMYRNLLLSDKYTSVWGQAIKKSMINLSILDTQEIDMSISMGEDVEINRNIYQNVKKVKIINKALYYYRENQNSVTHTYTEEKITRNILDIEKVYARIIECVKYYEDTELNNLAYMRYLFKLNGFLYYLIKYSTNKELIEYYVDMVFDSKYIREANKLLKYNEIIPKNRRIFMYLILKNKKRLYVFLINIIKKFK